MTARDYLDTGIAALGLLGGTENLPAAREAFRQAAELDPGMCDAWMGLAAAGARVSDGTSTVWDKIPYNHSCVPKRHRGGHGL